MTHPVAELIEDLRTKGLPPLLLDDLDASLRSRIAWTPLRDPRIPENTSFWQGSSGKWMFNLVDFPIGNQPGRRPDERGQNVAITHVSGIALFSDAPQAHRVATWLLARVTKHLESTFAGTGKTSSRVTYMRQTESFCIEDDESMLKAIAWTEKHIRELGSKIWMLPRSKTYIRFEDLTAYIQGHDRSTELVLTVMGYTLAPWPGGPITN